MTDNKITYHTLLNGLRVVHRYHPGAVECCGVAVNAGSRDEDSDRLGIAHFVEHTIFKGTSRRRSHHIINRMETVGGELNAYTTKEETMVYTLSPAGNLVRAAELIADLVSSSIFPADEIDREREVVADEINSYLDSPADAVYDDFEDLIFAGSQLGHNILGTTEMLAGFDTEACREYLHCFYTAPDMVFFYTGPAAVSRVIAVATRYFSSLPSRDAAGCRVEPAVVSPFSVDRTIDSHQAHNIIGARVGSMYSPSRHATALLTNILGGPGMNSRLNVALRERRGLVYSVDASTALFTDCGLMTIYFGCDPDDVSRCRHLVMNELDRLAQNSLTESQLARAKRQYLGQLVIASASIEQLALSTARATLYHNRALVASEIAECINAITPEDLRQAAELTAPVNCSTLTFA